MGILMAPFNGLMAIFREVADRAEAEMYDDEAVRAELVRLYQSLEAGKMTVEEFDACEVKLVERLDEIDRHKRAQAGR
jgi:hypothetical protein